MRRPVPTCHDLHLIVSYIFVLATLGKTGVVSLDVEAQYELYENSTAHMRWCKDITRSFLHLDAVSSSMGW